MAIPARINSDLAAIQAQVTAAAPLTSASVATVKAIQLNLDSLIEEVASAQGTTGVVLDTWGAPTDPAALALSLQGLSTSAADQSTLTDMLALLGRVNLNVDQIAA